MWKGKNSKSSSVADVNVAIEDYDNSNVITVSVAKSNQEWVLDYVYSFHMSPNLCWFENFKEMNGGRYFRELFFVQGDWN